MHTVADELGNIKHATSIGVVAVLVEDGLTLDALHQGCVLSLCTSGLQGHR